ncbi:unnamed protein product [Paramecium pentaurelia]|uniref:Pseudouridine synthase I TruA alpha/beta domain-containing protein n=1 Tax=Paramecium pentaurelia TaxID=43138 RepID=A0A8S1VRS4_9CILI|nr:unnamed protein product [Paramecium pentaurelia]
MSRNYFKQKVLLTFGYNGANYHGLQIQKGVEFETVESKLFQALKDSNLIMEQNGNDLSKSGWSRGARTDKGVHALCNSIAVKLCINKEFFKDDIQQNEEEVLSKLKDKAKVDYGKVLNVINSNLPNDIKVHSIKLVTQGFDVRKNARYRFYEYIAPVSIYSEKKGEEIIEKVNNLVKKFVGTHNFHNYSRGMKYTDPQSMRYILSIQVELFKYQDREFFKFLIHGQSFIYHQIRKMMGIVIQIFQEELPDTFIDNTFFKNQLRIILAPAEGLFLNRISFEGYNTKFDIPQRLEIEEEDQIKIDQFRPTIVDFICEQEIKNQTFSNWLKILKEKNFNIEEEEENNNKAENDD